MLHVSVGVIFMLNGSSTLLMRIRVKESAGPRGWLSKSQVQTISLC